MDNCKLCKERGKTWEGSDPRCAFRNGRFSKDNWNCATINRLREIIDEHQDDFTHYYRDDLATGTTGIIYCCYDFDEDVYGFTLIMKWYKDRGSVYNAFIIDNDGNILDLTEEIALKIINSVKNIEK